MTYQDATKTIKDAIGYSTKEKAAQNMSNDVYILRAWYPAAETAETMEGALNKLHDIVKNELSDPESFGLEISNIPIIYSDDGIIDMGCAQELEFDSCTIDDLKRWAK